MKPWFIQEDNVIPFRKKDTSVVRLPNVNAYPDFLTGVQDLQNHLKQGDISSDIHKKLYQDLIHRFMKVESFETPWFLKEELIQEYRTSTEYKGYKIEIHRTKVKPPYVATITSQSTKRELQRQGGETEQEALKNAQDSIDSMEAQAPTISSDSTTSILFNTLASGELLKDPSIYNDIYAKIDQGEAGPILVIGNETYGSDALLKAGFKKSSDRRPVKQKTSSEESMPQVMFPFSGSDLKDAGIKVNGRYVMDIEGQYQDEYQHTVYPLTFVGITIHSRDTLRMSKPGFTVGTRRNEDVERPWFLGEAPADQGLTGLGVPQQPTVTPNQGGISNLADPEKMRQRVLAQLAKKGAEDPVFQKIYKDIIVGNPIQSRIENYLTTRNDPDAINNMTYLIKNIPTLTNDVNKLKEFLNNLKNPKHDFINLDKLIPSSGMESLVDLIEVVSDPMAKELFSRMEKELVGSALVKGEKGASDAGPGEGALAILSPNITFAPDQDALEKGGDIRIKGSKVEVKGFNGVLRKNPVNQSGVASFLKGQKGKYQLRSAGQTIRVNDLAKPKNPKQFSNDFDTKGFIDAVTESWFGGTSSTLKQAAHTPAFLEEWYRLSYNFYAKEGGHKGILFLIRGKYCFCVNGNQTLAFATGPGMKPDHGSLYGEKVAQNPREMGIRISI